jgi:uncharacterized protein YceH (UPF0502 family)
MGIVLDNIEVRILGCLIEKEMTTPEYYPLSLNAMMNACNQKSNRQPVFSLEESAVLKGLDSLRQKGLLRETQVPGSRVTKYVHDLLSQFDLSMQEMAVLCELMLRGPQTSGELRSNTERIVPFGKIGEMEETLRGLIDHDPPLVTRLPREAGRREGRYAHLFSAENAWEKTAPDRLATAAASELPTNQAISKLEDEIAQIRRELEQLRQAFIEFKSQF